jgi:hypothetical protein
MSWYIQVVDAGLDAYVRTMRSRGIDPNGFKCATLAAFAGTTRSDMSTALQQYRMSQKMLTPAQIAAGFKPLTRYTIACEQYGPEARWKILSKPGSDPVVVQNARREHAKWSTRDSYRRLLTDYVHEVFPGLKGAQHDLLIERVCNLAENQFDATVQFVESML